MPDLLVQPVTILPLTLTMLLLLSAGYLLSVRGKSRATWWLVAAFVGFALFFLAVLVNSLFLYPAPGQQKLLTLTFFVGTGIGLWSLLHFAYRFLENPFAREARIALRVTGSLLVLDLGYAAYDLIYPDFAGNPDLPPPLLLGCIGWGTVVLLRKRRRALRQADAETPPRAARAYLAYALLNGLIILFLASQALLDLGVLQAVGWIDTMQILTVLGFFFGLVAVYLNHALEPTTIQAKLAGLTLVTTMALLAMVIPIVYPQFVVESARPQPPQQEALRFTPDGEGGYRVAALPPGLDDVQGERLALTRGSDTTVALGFDFPFYGRTHTEVIIDDDPIAAFGGRLGAFANWHTSEVPLILPLVIDLDPEAGGGVYLHRSADQATVTWHEVKLDDFPGTATVQLCLHADGTIDFRYGDIDPGRLWARGLVHDQAYGLGDGPGVEPELRHRHAGARGHAHAGEHRGRRSHLHHHTAGDARSAG